MKGVLESILETSRSDDFCDSLLLMVCVFLSRGIVGAKVGNRHLATSESERVTTMVILLLADM